MNKYLKNVFYQTPSYLVESLYDCNKIRNEEIIKHINNGLIELRNSINKKEIPENENPNKIVDTVEKILDFNKQQKAKGLPSDLVRVNKVFDRKVYDRKHIKILTPNKFFKDYQ